MKQSTENRTMEHEGVGKRLRSGKITSTALTELMLERIGYDRIESEGYLENSFCGICGL
ncbi:MAG: hypothetical protein ACE1Z9_04900 [Acidimicrobiia bacterium]